MAEELLTEHETERGPWMTTYTGRRFYLQTPQTDDVCIEDIAHALSMTCRYGGHCPYFFSVAEHSVACALEAKRRGVPPLHQLAVLLHDGAEAYTGDLISPIKQILRRLDSGVSDEVMKACYRFDDTEYVIQQNVNCAFIGGVPGPDLTKLIHAVDLAVGAAECLRFKIAITPGREMDAAPDFEPKFWPPELAEMKFLELYHQLQAEVQGGG